MRPTEFTTEQIIKAGIELQTEGKSTTGFAIRQKIGGGNPNRLKQIWDEYLATQGATQIEPVAELPIEVAEEIAIVTKSLTDRLATLAVELNNKAVKAAERRVTEVLRTAGEEREQAERELIDAAQTVDELEAQLDEARSKAEALEQRLNDSLVHEQSQAIELAQLRERLASVEKTALEKEESLKLAKTEAIEAREVAARLMGQMDALKEQNADLLAAIQSKQC